MSPALRQRVARWATLFTVGASACTAPGGSQILEAVDTGACDTATTCSGGDAPALVTGVHAPWWSRLTSSPPLEWDISPDALRVELAVGSAPGLDDVGRWHELDLRESSHQHRALFGLNHGDTAFPVLRVHYRDGAVSEWSTAGWTIDILPPDPPSAVDDGRVDVEGELRWSGAPADADSGFSHFEVRLGSSPAGGDLLEWTDVGSTNRASIDADLPRGRWHWASVRAVDVAGNASEAVSGPGVLACPTHYAFVPRDSSDDVEAFCVSRYEMRIAGEDDGTVGYQPHFEAESRPTGTPWASIGKVEARTACAALGDGYHLIRNPEWQSIAHGIAQVAENWSGGQVGLGKVSQGHTDGWPARALEVTTGDPCGGTENTHCQDVSHDDFSQRRTHLLPSGDVIWDFSGNLWEQVDGSVAGPDVLWVSFDHSVFLDGEDSAGFRQDFAPRFGWTEEHGLGRMYGGDSSLVRGGAYQTSTPGSAGALGQADAGIHAAHHKAWSPGPTHGFRCAFRPN